MLPWLRKKLDSLFCSNFFVSQPFRFPFGYVREIVCTGQGDHLQRYSIFFRLAVLKCDGLPQRPIKTALNFNRSGQTPTAPILIGR